VRTLSAFLLLTSAAFGAGYPDTTESDYILHDFHFNDGGLTTFLYITPEEE
jgi:hypothetical protein